MNVSHPIEKFSVVLFACVTMLSVSGFAHGQAIQSDWESSSRRTYGESTKSFVIALGNSNNFIKTKSHFSYTNPVATVGTGGDSLRVVLETVDGAGQLRSGAIVRIRQRASPDEMKYRYLKATRGYMLDAVFLEPHSPGPQWEDMMWEIVKLRINGDTDHVIRETSLVALRNLGTGDYLCTKSLNAATWLTTLDAPEFGYAWKFRSLYE